MIFPTSRHFPSEMSSISAWRDMKEHAVKLFNENPTELRRHALVSRDNRHRCKECFCCACLEVWANGGKMREKHYQ